MIRDLFWEDFSSSLSLCFQAPLLDDDDTLAFGEENEDKGKLR